MPSEQRLHPASIVFAFAKSAKAFLLPGVVLLISSNRSSGGPDGTFGGLPVNWELWLMLLMIPSGVAAVVRYLSYRIRYEGTELVIRSGIIFRNERHVPYARIQNLDAVQNLLHRLLGVVEVRVETGGGREPEARISVLPAAAFTEMRRRVFEGRGQTAVARDATASVETAAPPDASRPLLHLPLPELLLFGFLENRGLVVIGAAYGVAWELGLLERVWGGLFDNRWYAPFVVPTRVIESTARGELSIGVVAVLLAGLAGLLVLVRVISMIWAATRLYDFSLTRAGEDLHATYGLLTRIATTIPLRRVQTLTVRQGPLHRLLKRCSVQVETAGGGTPGSEPGKREREWLAPLIHERDLASLTREVLPELDLAALEWQPAHARAFRRAVKPSMLMAIVLIGGLAALVGWWSLLVLPLAAAWAIVSTRKYVDSLGWASTEHVVAFRSGWLLQRVTLARVARIQAVTQCESPFDRRTGMARVRVDTAGAGERSHRVDIPYLARETARELHRRLSAQAASTAFSTR
jgi:putative membrane protein